MEMDRSGDVTIWAKDGGGPAGTPVTPEAGVPVPAPPPRRRRRWLEVVGIVALALMGLGVVGALLEPDAASSDVVLDEDFEEEPYGFSTDSDRFVDLSVVDGTYQVTIEDGSIPQLARHVLTSTRDGVSFEATVVHPTGAGGAVFASVGCWAGESAYILMMSPEGEVGLLETIRESTGERRELTDLMPVDAARPAGEPNRLRIDCVGGGTDDTVVSGYLNGEPVLSVAVPDGYDSFDAVGFFLVAEEGGRFTLDDVRARAARPAPGMSPAPPADAEATQAAEEAPGAVAASDACADVFARAARAWADDDGTGALDVIGLEAPTACATFAEARAAWRAEVGGPPRGLEEYLARSCAYVGPSAGIRETDLCLELLEEHPELS